MEIPISGTTANAGGSPTMAGVSPVGPVADAAVSASAFQSVPALGGLRGGKARQDGLVPGSRAAAAADREKERVRKAAQRSRLHSDPPPLPGLATGADAGAPLAGGPGVGGSALGGPAVPWQAETLKPIFEQLLPTLEMLSVNQLTGRAKKARLPDQVVREIEGDAKWSAPAMQALQIGCPQLAAKYLNKSGVGAEYQPEVIVGTALASIFTGHALLLSKLDKLIASQGPGPVQPQKS